VKGDPLYLEFPDGRRCAVLVDRDIGAGLDRVWRPEWQEVAIIGDATVMALHGAALAGLLQGRGRRVGRLDFPAGEAHKARATKQALEDQLLAEGYGRQTCVIALGGGISMDLAGFVAATYLRGVPHVNVPTSLLAQVDAAIGGKTGVNTERGKNLIGAVHQPAAVLICSDLLDTLPADQWPNGLAELVKHAVIADAALFAWLESHAAALSRRETDLLDHPLRRSAEIKGDIVTRDELEQGVRSLLNFGHTVGHAIEHATGYAVPHGRAVALGMLVEGRIACSSCGFGEADLERLQRLLEHLGIELDLPGCSFDSLTPYMARDKKVRDDAIRMALPLRIGAMAKEGDAHTVPVAEEPARRAWEELQQVMEARP
jgi:3-dehydroquinate synthase